MQVLALIFVFAGWTWVQNAPLIFYGKAGLEMRGRHGRGSIGVKLFTGVTAFFVCYCIIALFSPSMSDISHISLMMLTGCLALYGVSAAVIRASTKKKLHEEGFISSEARTNDPDDWRIR